MLIHSFEPIIDSSATRLVLGTMPGKASLAAQEYYAFPRNAFWDIIEAAFGIPRTHGYAERMSGLLANRVAVWDVLQTCTRATSLDSDIVPETIIPNDFMKLFQRYPALRTVYFNGATAEKLYMKHVHPSLAAVNNGITYTRLPSTSPANAGVSMEEKLKAWSVLKNFS